MQMSIVCIQNEQSTIIETNEHILFEEESRKITLRTSMLVSIFEMNANSCSVFTTTVQVNSSNKMRSTF